MQALRRTRPTTAPTVTIFTTVFTGLIAAIALTISGPSAVGAAGFTCDASDGSTHTVAAGDSWYSIASQVATAPSELLTANDAELSDVLFPGDRLCLPGAADAGCGGGTAYTVRSGDSWYGLAQRSGTSARSLLDANGANTGQVIHPGQEICLPAGASAPAAVAGLTYSVVSGDSWYAIASAAGVSVRSVLDVNSASASSLLLPGDQVRLPAGATAPTTTAAASSIRLASAPIRSACWFSDTWGAPRSGGRSHQGVDVIAAQGSHVRAVVDGRLTRRAWDQPGKRAGNAWYLTGADGTVYFYGHLLDFAPGLEVGSTVSAGDIIGFVGATGNTTTPHLHLEIRPGGGKAVNPYQAVLAVSRCGRAIG